MTVPLSGLRRIAIGLPPIAEQRRIVAEVDRRLSIVREVETEVDANLKRAQALRQSVLQRAFSGEMVAAGVSASNAMQVEILAPSGSMHLESPSVVMAAKIIAANCCEPTFGRVKLQKILHLATYIGQVQAANDEYVRRQAGPLDMPMLQGVIKRLDGLGWFREMKRSNKSPNDRVYSYSALTKADDYKQHLHVLTPTQQKVIDGLNKLMRAWSTQDCELLSTVYASWNDLILWNHEPSVTAITDQVRNNWHESKKKFSPEKIAGMIDKIKRLGYEPTGFGRPTAGEAVDALSGELFSSRAD